MLEFAALLESIAKLSPIFLALCGWLYYTITKLNKREDELSTINAEYRNSEKENMKTLQSVNETLNKVINEADTNQETVIKEISLLKEYINIKFSDK